MQPETDPPEGYVPEMKEGGLDCFLSDVRPCGPSCMAFVTSPRFTDKSELSHQQQHCSLLTSVERVGRHLPILASILDSGQKTLEASERRKKTQDADRQRENAMGHTNPFPTRKP